MGRRIGVMVAVAVAFAATACGPQLIGVSDDRAVEQRLFQQGAFQRYTEFAAPAFQLEAQGDVFEIVWLDDRASRGNRNLLPWPDTRCLSAADRTRCLELLTAAVGEVARLDIAERMVAPTFEDENCVMCTPQHGYAFVVSEQDARVIDRAGAMELFGVVDAPGEAVVVLGRPALVRPLDGGFELVTTSEVCNPEGPRRTTWRVDADGTVERGVEWMEGLGDDCADV